MYRKISSNKLGVEGYLEKALHIASFGDSNPMILISKSGDVYGSYPTFYFQ